MFFKRKYFFKIQIICRFLGEYNLNQYYKPFLLYYPLFFYRLLDQSSIYRFYLVLVAKKSFYQFIYKIQSRFFTASAIIVDYFCKALIDYIIRSFLLIDYNRRWIFRIKTQYLKLNYILIDYYIKEKKSLYLQNY